MAEREDPEFPDVPEHNLPEEDMMIVSLRYEYIRSHVLSDTEVAALEIDCL
jgi:hypothetical protein